MHGEFVAIGKQLRCNQSASEEKEEIKEEKYLFGGGGGESYFKITEFAVVL